MIRAERSAADLGKPARIIAKLNALTDPVVIKALYKASSSGVQVDLIIRGICCLKPGIPGVSDNIRVKSIVGRFLEHSRVYYFLNNSSKVYCSSADWMERNLSNRIEVCFPILKKKLANRIINELELYLEDQVQSWELNADGSYCEQLQNANESIGVQMLLQESLGQT